MELYLDTPDVVAAAALSCILPPVDVAINPGIIATGKKPLEVVLPQPHEAMGGQGRLFAQIMATIAEGVVDDARKLCSIIADIAVKVLATVEGLTAVKMLKTGGIPTLGVAVYGTTQGLLSAPAGAEYVAPYVDRIDAQGDGGIQTVTNLHRLLKMHAPQVKVLATSFKTLCQALDCLLVGHESITLPLNAAQQMINYPAVDVAVVRFEQGRLGAFDRTLT